MLARWYEPFMLLEASRTPDGLGGSSLTLTDDIPFRGVLTLTVSGETTAAGQPALTHQPVLLYELDVTLSPGDYVRRERDGAVFRVTGRAGDLRAPAFSGLQFAQAPVERWECAC